MSLWRCALRRSLSLAIGVLEQGRRNCEGWLARIQRGRPGAREKVAGNLSGPDDTASAREDEQRRIARELHDGIGQLLTALRLSLEALSLAPAALKDETGRERLERALGLCQQAEDEVDRLIRDLRPPSLDDLGIVEAIRSQAEARLGGAGIRVEFRVSGEQKRLPRQIETALFRIAQEGITNIAKHARAGKASILLRFGENDVAACIEDDGCGFEIPGETGGWGGGHHLGLAGMRERVSLVGGSLTVASRPGAGTSLRATIPLTGEEART